MERRSDGDVVFGRGGPGDGELRRGDVATETVYRLPIASLKPSDTPRLHGEDVDYVRVLAALETPLPPILVQRSTLQVIDGMHRVRAAIHRGWDSIEAKFFDGPADMIFIAAVEANVKHGRPLSTADREAAAARILTTHPDWSDRSIARTAGLAASTVAGIRSRTGACEAQQSRIGLDGRRRPVDAATSRRRVVELLASRPAASLREIARLAGVSPTTVREVRLRLERETAQVSTRSERRQVRLMEADVGGSEASLIGAGMAALDNLRRDPSLRYSEAGRQVLRWLAAYGAGAQDWACIANAVPLHCASLVADVVRNFAANYSRLAERLDERVRLAA